MNFTTIYSWDFNLTQGLNKILFSSPYIVERGQLLILTQNTARIAIDSSKNYSYSDLVLFSNNCSRLSLNNNFRFFVKPLTNHTLYQTTFFINRVYQSIGYFNLSLNFFSSNSFFNETIKITDCKF